jgi:hypothetical protein
VNQSTNQSGSTLVGGAQNDSLTATDGSSTISGGQGDDGYAGRNNPRHRLRTVARRTAKNQPAYYFRQIVRMKRAA